MTPFKRLKTLIFAIFTGLSLWTAPTHAAGTLPLAMAVQIDINGKPLAGCQVTFFVAGTVATLQQVFGDFGLTTPIGNPLTCDQAGRVPMFWLADGLIHVRLTDSFGLQVIDTTMQVLGPSSGGGGGGGTVDPTTVLATGDWKLRYGNGPLSGFVRCNGLTIGNLTSGASERANADTIALFIYLYNTDPNLAISGGRSGNALNDFNANKQLTLPDARARLLGAVDGMGNSLSGRFANTLGSSASTLGVAGGAETVALTLVNLPAGITSIGSATGITVISSLATIVQTTAGNLFGSVALGSGGGIDFNNAPTIGTITSTGSGSASVTSNNTGGAPTNIANPLLLVTLYIKL